MKVFFVRHGESETNRSGHWTGWTDVSLTEKGRADAAKAGALLSDICFDKIYASDLSRAKRTAEIALPCCEYETTPLLREINVGELAGRKIVPLLDEEGKPLNRNGYALFGGESMEQMKQRVTAFMRELETLDAERVAVFSHAGVLRTFLDVVLDIAVPRKKVCCNNCTVAIFEYDDAVWKLHSWINLE